MSCLPATAKRISLVALPLPRFNNRDVQAPEARHELAQTGRSGYGWKMIASPVGGDTNLSKHVFRIEGNPVLSEQTLEFLLIGFLPMMLFLVCDVTLHGAQI